MEWLKDMFIEMDWRQFIPSLVATIIGIFGPFWIQSMIEKVNKKKAALKMICQIKRELKDIAKEIKKLEDNKRYIDPIKTPIWTGIQNTNEISLLTILRKKKKKANKQKSEQLESVTQNDIVDENNKPQSDWYKAVYSIYGLIDEFNKWCNLYSEQRTAGRPQNDPDIKTVKNCINDLENTLCSLSDDEYESIQYVLNLLDNVLTENKCKEQSE